MKVYGIRPKGICYLIVLIFSMMVGLIIGKPAEAASADVPILKAKAGFNGYVRMGEPVFFSVEIENPGPELRGALKVHSNYNQAQVVFRREVVLPEGARKKVTLYAADNQGQSYNLILASGDKEIASTRVNVKRLPAQELMVGVLAANPSAFNHIGNLKLPGNAQRATVVHLNAENIPADAVMLESIDVLIISDFSSSSLSFEQLSCIKGWVESGGLLVECGGAAWKKTIMNLPEDLNPVNVSGSIQVNNLTELEQWTGQSLPGGTSIILSQVEEAAGITLIKHGELPILVESKLGHGHIYYLAFDPGAHPFTEWAGNESMWLNLITRSDPHQMISSANARIIKADMIYNMNYLLRSIPASDLPSRGWLALVLIIYILILGPGLYFLLKKWDRRELGWIVIPITSVLLFAATYYIGFKGEGRDIFTRLISIVELEPGFNYARVNSYIGSFAPTYRDYSIDIPGNRLVNILSNDYYLDMASPLPNNNLPIMATVTQGQDTKVEFSDMTRWSTRSIHTKSSIYQPGQIEADLYTEGNRIVGTVTNHTKQTLSDCTLFSRYGYQKLNKLEPGESAAIDFGIYMTLQNRSLYNRLFDSYPIHYPSGYNPTSAMNEGKRRILEMYLVGEQGQDNNGVMLVGWSEEEVPGVMKPNGRGQVYPLTAWFSLLPVNFIHDNKVSIPPGIINGRVIEVNASHCEQNWQGVQFGGGAVTFQLDLPLALKNLQVTKLDLLAPTDNFQVARGINMELYNWSTGIWETISYQMMGNPINGWRNYVSESGSLRVRISPSAADGYISLQGVTLSLEADYLEDDRQDAAISGRR